MPFTSAPLCDRHDDSMVPGDPGQFSCQIPGCTRHYNTREGYHSPGDAAPPNAHPCPACGELMYIGRFTAHGPKWHCEHCDS